MKNTKNKNLKIYIFKFPHLHEIKAWEAYSLREAKGLARYWLDQCKKLPNGTKCWMKDQSKLYNIMNNVGKVKYLINFHDGIKMHSDGSPFFDIATFSNKKKHDSRVSELLNNGYVYKN